MKKLLIMGINTRGLVNSCINLPYQCYSISYYLTSDFKFPVQEKHLLNQYDGKSCGFFEKNYSPENLLELSLDYIEEVDHIILSSGISSSDFKGKFKKYKKKILGNHNIENTEDKYKFYRKIKNKYLTPRTFKINHENTEDNIDETLEIIKQNNAITFIIKPIEGSGGYGVNYLKYDDKNKFKKNNSYIDFQNFSNYEKCGFIIQEYIEGTNISSSVLSTKNESKTIMISKMLTESDFSIKNSFKYCGNIVPFNLKDITDLNNSNNSINPINYTHHINSINNISEELISQLKLVGSNGIDMILTNKYKANKSAKITENEDPYIIEVNPRFQGTYECIEEVLGINLLYAHIKACNDELINIPKTKKDEFSIKRIIYSNKKIKVGNITTDKSIYDIPHNGVVIEKDEPLVTIVTPKNNLESCKNILKNSMDEIDKNINPYN